MSEEIKKPADTMSGTQVMSGLDAQIHGLVQGQPDTLVSRPVSKSKFNLYGLPECCKKFTDKYSFKWVGKNERQLTRATEVEHWVICTRKNAAFIDGGLFKVHGAVERNGCLLAFMLKEDANARNAKYRDVHNNRKKALKELPKQGNFYEAKLSKKEEEGARGVGEQQQGRDF